MPRKAQTKPVSTTEAAKATGNGKARNLLIVLGDQLDAQSPILKQMDPAVDSVWMAEVSKESTHVWSHKTRSALFLSAMRHFRDELQQQAKPTHYTQLDDSANTHSLGSELERSIDSLQPTKLRVVQPGDYRVQEELKQVANKKRIPLEIVTDTHFLSTLPEFEEHAAGRKQLRLEFFYRELRQKTGILMDGEEPTGGEWNFDHDNRKSFGKTGPGLLPNPAAFSPDATTQEVIRNVEQRFANHPGLTKHFDWPVTREQALQALDDFIQIRLANFGDYQDAMWTNQPWLYHSRLSAALNLKLLHPGEVIAAAEEAYKKRKAPLPAVEGFIRQILGWREYVRGIYWKFMPGYADGNALNAHQPLPKFFWNAQTDMNCLRQSIGQTLDYGYAHHIQRLMVTGLFSLLLGVKPREIHEWYLAVYVDAVEWVEMPNVIGMSQYADGGIMASKPYAASGAYISRMSNYCQGCRYKPTESTGPNACPFTTLYWDFLARNETLLKKNQRMGMQMKNLERQGSSLRADIRKQADQWKDTWAK